MWKKLQLKIRSLDIFKSYTGKGEISLGVGNKEAKIMIIMNNIDDESLKENLYNCFEAKKLKNVLRVTGLDINNDIYLTSFYKLDSKKAEINPKNMNELLDILLSEIILVNPSIIITLGEEVFKIILSDALNMELSNIKINFEKNVLNIYDYKNKILIPLYSMEEISNIPKEKKLEVVDILKKIKEKN